MPSGTVSWVPGELRGWGLPGWGGPVPAPHPQQARSPPLPPPPRAPCVSARSCPTPQAGTPKHRDVQKALVVAQPVNGGITSGRDHRALVRALPAPALLPARPQASPPTPSRPQPPLFQLEPFWPPAPRGQTELLAQGSKDPRTRTPSGLCMLRSSSEGGESGGGREARRAVSPGLRSLGNI